MGRELRNLNIRKRVFGAYGNIIFSESEAFIQHKKFLRTGIFNKYNISEKRFSILLKIKKMIQDFPRTILRNHFFFAIASAAYSFILPASTSKPLEA